jgi:hypothetical protein
VKEHYLHQIWLLKRLPMHQLKLVDGRDLEVLKTGWHNHESGPDFFNGSIRIDGIQWNGNIEIHIKSSDWYAHKHQHDLAYNNVILHVVLEDDQPVWIENIRVPTLELKSLIDYAHWRKFEQLEASKTWIPCSKGIDDVDSIHKVNQIESALIQRLNRKAAELHSRFERIHGDVKQLQFELFAIAMGSKVNVMPFIELTQRISVNHFRKSDQTPPEVFTLGIAGFLSQNSNEDYLKQLQTEWKFVQLKFQFAPMENHAWKFFGLRPPGYPPFRLTQFAYLMTDPRTLEWNEISVSNYKHYFNLLNKITANIPSYWQNHYQLEKESASKHTVHLSSDLKIRLMINEILPFLWWWSQYQNDEKMSETVLELLQALKSEKNQLLENWKSLGMQSKSAFDSQGLIELKNEFCAQKKCLDCKIGISLLNR